MEYFVISEHCPDLYKAVSKIFEDYGISKDIKVVIRDKNSSEPPKNNNFPKSHS